jgi:hypothetical protein
MLNLLARMAADSKHEIRLPQRLKARPRELLPNLYAVGDHSIFSAAPAATQCQGDRSHIGVRCKHDVRATARTERIRNEPELAAACTPEPYCHLRDVEFVLACRIVQPQYESGSAALCAEVLENCGHVPPSSLDTTSAQKLRE